MSNHHNDGMGWRKLSETFGLCIQVADLKSPNSALALALHLGDYRPFYLLRDEDRLARKYLQEHSGVLIIGRPWAGKTRMALEVVLAAVPDGVLLRFSGPQRLANLDALVIPSVLIDGKEKKPSLVLFFDDIDKFDGASFDDLIDCLHPQVSNLYVVGTCRSGALARVLASASFKNLRVGPFSPSRIVEIMPLTPLQASQAETEIWKTDPGRDLGLDRTEIGVILRGSKILESEFRNLKEDGQSILRGLYLAECVASPCPKDLVQQIVEGVVQNGPLPSFDAILTTLVQSDAVQRDELSRLSIASNRLRDEVSKVHYPSGNELRRDLKRVESVLREIGDATQLTALAIYYGERLNALREARRVLETSLELVRHTETLSVLSLVLARSGEEDAARPILEECLRSVPEPDSQANLLIRFGDELIVKKGRLAAIPFYERACGLAQAQATKMVAAIRSGDALFSDNEFDKAEPIYREFLDQTTDDAKYIIAARLVVAIIGQGHFARAAEVLCAQFRDRAMAFRHSLAAAILENGENRFLLDERLAALRKVVWEAIRDTTEVNKRADDLLAFATDMIFRGFLTESKIAYAELRKIADNQKMEPIKRAELVNNLATSHLYLREPKEARPLFEETLSLLHGTAGTPDYFLAAGEDGLAACDILEGNLQSAKKRYEELLRTGKTVGNETITAWAHLGLGGLAWEEGNFAGAHEHFFAVGYIPNSFDTIVRSDLGRARVCLHYGWLDDADFHIARGLTACARADYAYRRTQFEKLKEQSAAKRATAPAKKAASTAPKAIEALIMKGGGVKGLAFAGAIRELEMHYSFETFVGTSAGAIAAAFLAAGATGAQLETKLRSKSFRDFLDGNLWLAPFRILITWGLHPGNSFVNWLREELNQFVPQAGEIKLNDLPKRVVIYASSAGRGEIAFDKDGDLPGIATHFAVRCSMSIPYFFEPQSFENRRVFDGGMLNNYPVEVFLKKESERKPPRNPTFVALYLGSVRPSSLKPRLVIAELLSIWLERNDAAVIDKYRNDTVVIDTSPIGTVDFDLTEKEKSFLVLAGRAAALEFLNKRGVLDQARVPSVAQTRADVELLRAEIKDLRQKYRARRWFVVIIIIVALVLALGLGVFR